MSEGAKRAAKRLDENFDKLLAEATKPVELGPASGEWISAREAKATVERISEVNSALAVAALCRRAVIAVPVRASTFSRGEEPHDYIDRFEFFEGREPDLSHFKRSIRPTILSEICGFFEVLGDIRGEAETGIGYAEWETGDFKVTVPMDFSDVTLTVVGLQFDRTALLHSLGEESPVAETKGIALPASSGGRPARKHGEAISAVTLRLAKFSTRELSNYTAESVGAELAAEYKRLGESAPHVANLARFGAGILRTLRNEQPD